jgi:tetratricopeptide (TPR) repeat protein
LINLLLAKKQTTHWQDTISLWSHNITHQKGSFSYGMRGNLYYEQKMFSKAEADFIQVHKNPDERFEPEKYNYMYNALGLMASKKDPAQAVVYFTMASNALPSSKSFQNTGMAYKLINDFVNAESYFLKSLEFKENAKSYFLLASLYFETKEFQKGKDILTKAIDIGFKEIPFYKMRCFFEIELKQFDLAVIDLKILEEMLQESGNQDNDVIGLRLKLSNYLK